MKIVLASGNAGKLKELGELLAPHALELIAQGTLGIEPAEETGCTFIENALEKARHASRESGLPALADDSGISVASLNGAPGVYSARFAGPNATDADNKARLLETLKEAGSLGEDNAPTDRTRAHYYCVIVLLRHPEDPTPLVASGRWDGQITGTPSGTNGFGYDPYFWLPERGMTAAELSPDEKNRISHRGQAVRALCRQLETSFG